MIAGEYPCCGGPLMLSMPDNGPGLAPEDCPHCGARVWHYYSRIDPKSWTEADFLTQYEVDEANLTIRKRSD